MTYTELVKRTEMAAAGLQKFGIAKGDVICVISQNQLDFVVAFYASALIGSIFQPIDPSYSAGNFNKSFVLYLHKWLFDFLMVVMKLIVKPGIENDFFLQNIENDPRINHHKKLGLFCYLLQTT